MKDEFIIPLNGLKPGRTSFSWHVGTEFFRRFENTEIIDADIVADVVAEKSGSYLGVDCSLSGTLTVPCDRCMEDVVLPVDAKALLSVKFGAEPVSEEEITVSDEREIVYLPEDGVDMDLSQTVYDYACLSLPMQRVHEEGKCNPEALKYLSGEGKEREEDRKTEENNDTYNPFAVLKGLKLD